MQQPQSGQTVQRRTEMRAYLRAQALELALRQMRQMGLRLRQEEQKEQEVQGALQVQEVLQALLVLQAMAQQREWGASSVGGSASR